MKRKLNFLTQRFSLALNSFRFSLPYYLIAFTIFVILVLIIKFSLTPKGYYIPEWIVLKSTNLDTTDIAKIPYYIILKSEGTVFLKHELKDVNLSDDKYYLYLPQIDGAYLAVYSNDRLIGSYGFANDRLGHFWYQPFIFELPPDTKSITLEISGVYEVGIDFKPVIIPESEKSKYMILYIITHVLLLVSIGLSLTLSIILFLISKNLSDRKKSVYLHFSISSLLGTIWMFDLIPFPTMGSSFTMLLFRKIFVASAYFGLGALIYGIQRQNFEKVDILTKIFVFIDIGLGIIILLSWNHYMLKVLSNNFASMLLVNGIYLTVKISQTYSPVQIMFSFFFVLTVIHDGISVWLSSNQKLLSMYGIVSLFAGFAYSLVNEYKDMIVGLSLAHMRSITDSLTGAYSRGALSELVLNATDALIYIDLNNFKVINDKYGHDVGDEILKILVNLLKSSVRKSDAVVRMGGDEFLVILRECPVEKAKEIIEKARKDFNNAHELNPDFSYGVVQYTESFQKSLHDVDKLMYQMKQKAKKNEMPT